MATKDEKGKVFTDVIKKDQRRVIVQTRTSKIIGVLHKQKDQRLTDTLNQADKFIALTEVEIYEQGRKIHEKAYLALNTEEVIWLVEE